jgi:hypothetical protein
MGNVLRAVAVLSLIPAAARADAVETSMELHGSTLDVKVTGAVMPPPDELSVALAGEVDEHAVYPLVVRSYVQGGEAISIMFVVSGQEVWMGNDAIETDPTALIPDALGPLEAAIDSLDLAHRVPPGSQAGFVTYARGARVRVPLAPIGQLQGIALGTQHDYYNTIGSDLAAGISTALGQLERAPTPRKMLIVIGDGNDTKGDDPDAELAVLKKRAAADRIEMAALIYKQRFSSDTNQITRIIPNAKVVMFADRFADQLDWLLQRVTRRFYAQFDISSLPVWDGRDHDLSLTIAGDPQDPVTLGFPKRQTPPPWWRSLWLQLAVGLLGVGTLALLARRVR